jgi:hypothetical protein
MERLLSPMSPLSPLSPMSPMSLMYPCSKNLPGKDLVGELVKRLAEVLIRAPLRFAEAVGTVYLSPRQDCPARTGFGIASPVVFGQFANST